MIEDLFKKTKAIEVLIALRDGPKKVVELHGVVGGSMSTLESRLRDLIDGDYLSEDVSKEFPFKRILQLTSEGKRIADVLVHMGVSFNPAGMPSGRKWILALIHSFGELSITTLQKLLFLLKVETKTKLDKDFYVFDWYKFGPYTEEIDRDVRKLEMDGFIDTKTEIFGRDEQGDEIRKMSFHLSDRGSEKIKEILDELDISKKNIAHLKKYANMTVKQLVDDVHKRYEEKFEGGKNA